MNNKFTDALTEQLNITTTENGAKAFKSTLNACLDLFNAVPLSNVNTITTLFDKAYDENPETALRIMFWGRDIKEGQGRRDNFQVLLQHIARNNPQLMNQLIKHIPEIGYWKDVLALYNTPCWLTVLNEIQHQLSFDLRQKAKSEPCSLLAKWLPSVNASSKLSRQIGLSIADHLYKDSFSSQVAREKCYRTTLSSLRKHIDIVESKMSAREWDQIEYQTVPSRAATMYRKAFLKRDNDRYKQYLSDVLNGKAKINANTVYPYELVYDYLYENSSEDSTLEAQWKALPNYIDKPFNGLVVADVSGSMYGRPLAVCISLAIYISERNPSELWRNKFITFSESPELQTVVGNTIKDKIHNLEKAKWDMNTDLVKVFELILNTAKTHQLSQEDIPSKLILVSDMQFDHQVNVDVTPLQHIKQMYVDSGYEVPQVIFWNVNSKDNMPITFNEQGVLLISGYSPTTMKNVLSDRLSNPIDLMHNCVYNDRYDFVAEAMMLSA